MDCDAPTTFEELREWRAEDGIPREIHQEIASFAEQLLTDLEALGCDVLPTDDLAPVSCVTSNGYTVEGEGWRDFVGGDHGCTLSISASDAATGDLPTGDLDYASYYAESEGTYGNNEVGFRMSWTFEDPAASGLGFEGDVTSSWVAGGDSCGSSYLATIRGTWQGCALDLHWYDASWISESTAAVETETFAVNEWSASVTTYACRNTVGVFLGRTAFLDDDWHELVRTDADGDHCAAEDCDCNDGDAAVSPNTYDEGGDGLDLDCDGRDNSGWTCDWWDYDNRCDREEDSGVGEDSGATDDTDLRDSGASEEPGAEHVLASEDSADTASATPPPPSSDPGCSGCSTPATPGAALLLALGALFRRRR